MDMLQMMEMLKIFQEMNGQGEKPCDGQPQMDASFFTDGGLEERINTPALSSIKAAIPYLDVKYQRFMIIMIKVIELQRMMELYSTKMANMKVSGQGDWRRGMLSAIRPHMDKGKQEQIDMMFKMMDMMNMMKVVQNMGGI